MEQTKPPIGSEISSTGRVAAAQELGCADSEVEVASVSGGYSRNRRSLVGHGDRWIFAKEVDVALLPDEGKDELGWLRKEYECVGAIRKIVPEIVSDWSKLATDGHVLLMPSYRAEDGWIWEPPSEPDTQRAYIQAVVDATKQLEPIVFSDEDIERLKLQPHFRDEIALDDGLELIIKNDAIRNMLSEKYAAMSKDQSLAHMQPAIAKMQYLLQDKAALQDLSVRVTALMDQPSDCFGHSDVRSDNIAYNPTTGDIKFVDWNWASYATAGFGATEFLTDMARRGVDVSPWVDDMNPEMLAALVGFFAKRCLDEPLAPGNTLRDMQAQSAAVALSLYEMAASR